MSSRQKKDRDFSKVILRFDKNFPEFKHNMNKRDVAHRVSTATHCEISGIPFVSLDKVYVVPVYLFDKNIINVNRIILVNRLVRSYYRELYDYILENPNVIDIEQFNKSDARFNIAKEKAFEQYKNHGRDFESENVVIYDNFDHIYERYDTKTKQELININIAISREKESINNLDKKLDNSHIVLHRKNLIQVPNKSGFTDRLIKFKIRRCHERSKAKGLTCDVNFENAKHLFEVEYCQLTGMRLDKTELKNGKHLPNTFTLDRINRFEGYNLHNIAVICHEANDIKSDLERFNYTEDLDRIKEIFKEVRFRVWNKYKGNSSYKFNKKIPSIDAVFNQYIKMRNEHKKAQFTF